jgi:hypothetical protein
LIPTLISQKIKGVEKCMKNNTKIDAIKCWEIID